MDIIRGLIQTLTGSVNRIFTAFGRPDETIKGKLYQHFGFRSSPPVGCELLTIQYGNNNVCVAENDGSAPGTVVVPNTNETAIYSNNGKNSVWLRNDAQSLTSTVIITADKKIDISSGSITQIYSLAYTTTQPLMTEAYKTSLELYLTAVNTFISACTSPAAMIAANAVFKAAYPLGFIAPADGLTQTLEAS